MIMSRYPEVIELVFLWGRRDLKLQAIGVNIASTIVGNVVLTRDSIILIEVKLRFTVILS